MLLKSRDSRYLGAILDQKAVNKFFNPYTKLGTCFNAEFLNALCLKILIFIGSFHSPSTAPETCHTEHTSISDKKAFSTQQVVAG